jgi:hypothetical protein
MWATDPVEWNQQRAEARGVCAERTKYWTLPTIPLFLIFLHGTLPSIRILEAKKALEDV